MKRFSQIIVKCAEETVRLTLRNDKKIKAESVKMVARKKSTDWRMKETNC